MSRIRRYSRTTAVKRTITVRVGQGEKQKTVEAILWIDEVPPECRRGKNRKMKNRKFKREKMQSLVEEPQHQGRRLEGGGQAD